MPGDAGSERPRVVVSSRPGSKTTGRHGAKHLTFGSSREIIPV